MAQLLLKAGDIMLYRPAGIFGLLIAVKTWHRISHVEIYDGQKKSWASRDGQGYNLYDTRLSQLCYVLRPEVSLDLAGGRTWAQKMVSTPYGWLDLVNFVGIPVDAPGIVCSPAAAGFLRACGWDVFPEDPINRVSPMQFLDLVQPGICSVAYDPTTIKESLIRATAFSQ